MPAFVQTLMALPARTKGVLAVSAVAILAICFILLKLATAPSYALLSSGLDPAQTGKVTAALDAQGIAYELRANGTALAVNKAQIPQARIALASGGVDISGGGHQPGYELLDQTKLGTSQFQQQITYQRALEGEIARTINGVEGVSGASVQLVLPQDTLFADEQSQATAAVMLSNQADALQPGAVRGIAQLTASSVKGLKSDAVTITDGSGQLLWPMGDGSSGGGGAGATKQAAEARYDRQLESTLNAMLASTLGPGKAQVRVNADLNVDKINTKELTYGKTGVPTKSTTDVEKLKGSGATSGGTAGTGSNIPTYSTGTGAGSGNSNYTHTIKSSDQAVDKKITTTDIAPGAINKLTVALMLDKSVPPAVATSLKQTVAAAAGVNTTRGDSIMATQMAFAKAPIAKTGPVPTTLLGPLKWVGLGFGALLFLFFMSRHLRKRETESLGTPAWLKEIEEPISLARLEQASIAEIGQAGLPPRVPDASLHQLDQLMEREPERVAAQVKQWMAAD
jgi:flagellar M-ring protein FliF